MNDDEVGSSPAPSGESEIARHLDSLYSDSRRSLAADVDGTKSRAQRRALKKGEQFGKYTIIERLGAGGMGIVYHAYDSRLQRGVALKTLAPRSLRGALSEEDPQFREARALALIKHPNVVMVHDVIILDEVVCIDMEFVSGETLRKWAATRSWREILTALIQTAEGTAAVHAARIVHCDLKPDNVMITVDGVVKILDFGLADESSGESVATQPDDELSRASPRGRAGGTPKYMAPELHLGNAANVLSDQFSFCVMAWELLYGGLPGAGVEANGRGEFERRPPEPRVPAWLRRTIARGLASEPSRRWKSMDALLKALRDGRASERRRGWLRRGVAVAAAVVAIVAGVVWKQRSDMAHEIGLCAAAGARIDGVWNDDAREALRSALVGAGDPLATTSADKVASLFDRYTEEWRRVQTDVCLDASVRGRLPQALVDRAQWCLEARYLSLDSLAEAFANDDVKNVNRMVPAALSLPGVDVCGDREFLEQMPDLPQEGREELRALRAELLRLSRLEFGGEYEAGVRAARDAIAQAEALHAPSIAATALYQLGLLQMRRGEYDEAEKSLEEAFFSARDAGAIEVVPNAGVLLVGLLGQGLARYDDALRWARHTRQALTQLRGRDGSPTAVLRNSTAAALDNSVALALLGRGDYEGAQKLFERALATWEPLFGEQHHTAHVLNNLADLHRKLGRYDQALELHQRALAIREATLGPGHPDTGMSLYNVALVYYEFGRFTDARLLLLRVLGIEEATTGPEHPETAVTLDLLGLMEQELGEFEDAGRRHDRALQIRRAVFDPKHPRLASSYANIAQLRMRTGRFAEAEELIMRALEIRTTTLRGDDPAIVPSLLILAELRLATNTPALAKEPLERSLRLREAALGREHPDLAPVLVGLARVALAEGRAGTAVELATRATALYAGPASWPTARAEASIVLARALWEQGTERPRALKLAGAARDAYQMAGPGYRRALVEVDEWLAAR